MASIRNVSAATARLMERLPLLPQLATPQRTANGTWRKPVLSLRKLADMKKLAAVQSQPWPLPEPTRKPMKFLTQPPKGRKADREAAKRQETIKANMARMPQIIADWRREMREAKEKKKPELPF